jgi:phosphotransferase system  glucose/maltose/N-acetylglucosamine-specific IIC component
LLSKLLTMKNKPKSKFKKIFILFYHFLSFFFFVLYRFLFKKNDTKQIKKSEEKQKKRTKNKEKKKSFSLFLNFKIKYQKFFVFSTFLFNF